MSITTEEDREQLRGSVRALLNDRSSSRDVRRVMASGDGVDRELYRDLAGMLGLQALATDEAYGGLGLGWTELGVAFEELGRSLACVPALSTLGLGMNAIKGSGDKEAMAELLPAMADGSVVSTVACAWATMPEASRSGGSWRVTGRLSYVLDGQVADVVLAPARANGAVGLYALRASEPGLTAEPLSTMDLTRRMAHLRLDAAEGQLVGAEDAGLSLVNWAETVGWIALSSEQVGGAAKCLEMAVEYAKDRVAFGRPIGSYQAVKHRCADMLLAAERSACASESARGTLDSGSDDVQLSARMAKAFCSQAFVDVAKGNIQIHGGIGFTWDHDAHLYYKRARSGWELLGSPVQHRRAIAAEMRRRLSSEGKTGELAKDVD